MLFAKKASTDQGASLSTLVVEAHVAAPIKFYKDGWNRKANKALASLDLISSVTAQTPVLNKF